MQIDESDIWTASTKPTLKINFSEQQKFLQEGYLVLRDVFDRTLIAEILSDIFQRLRETSDENHSADSFLVGNARMTLEIELRGSLNQAQIYANEKIYPLMGSLLGEHFIVGSLGAVVSMPGAPNQHIHYDHPPLFPELDSEQFCGKISPYAIHCFIPLTDVNAGNGRTRIWPKSHLLPVSNKSKLISEAVYTEENLEKGDCLLLDYRTLHAGLENNSSQIRPLMYLIYQRGWFRDIANYGQHEPLVISEAELRKIPQKYQHLFSWKIEKHWSMIKQE